MGWKGLGKGRKGEKLMGISPPFLGTALHRPEKERKK
jgi:hypothetical protein